MHRKYIITDEWKIIEKGFDPALHPCSESLFSIGNGRMGQRANFEETYSGRSMQGSYIGGVYYPDKTRVGWWKNGYPEYFAKVINSVNWIGIDISIDGQPLDLAKVKVSGFYRELNMKEGYLLRKFTAQFDEFKTLEVEALRFISMKRHEIGAIRYSITPRGFSPKISYTPYLDFDVYNEDSNYGEKFWDEVFTSVASQKAINVAATKKTNFHVAAAMRYELEADSRHLTLYPENIKREKYVANRFEINAQAGTTYTLYKYAAITSSLNYPIEKIAEEADYKASEAMRAGFDALLEEQKKAWAAIWETSDIVIEGDPEAQQGIRFNIFQLNQTYTGEDERLNIGPKGFTGEKYGGVTYWDTEAYCFPFYLSTRDPQVARNLLLYRYRHLPKAIENACKLGFTDGAALYPMVTINGEECHNEWEITFEEIHRNGAMVKAIHRYVEYTGDFRYLADYGLEVMIAIARFWAQRFNWSEEKQQYVMLGVTGPNEYENNINNNFYTSYIARWCLEYTLQTIELLKNQYPKELSDVFQKTNFDTQSEPILWKKIISNIYFPYSEKYQIYLQQEGYLDKIQQLASEIPHTQRPINQHWSWDRILRSCFIKQADTLQAFYFFEDHFTTDEHQRHFDFYEPRTVHESSLSPCVHVVLAAKLGKLDKAYELYLRTSRLDLDDYNKEVHEGLHITSMAGTWMSVVEGFGGMRVRNQQLYFNPVLPRHWKRLSFKIIFHGRILEINTSHQGTTITRHTGDPLRLDLKGQLIEV
ncbi:family 65 glycosyl hydrolase domain-containing protein [Schleiferia thermophila]|uniref:Maltose phosphorylase n=1 Tax=Schleiferia thermophila TaxID=884107 RepID=A0A369A0T2_9FLAO|nr:family 65 glycosyl hydrolase domain-containing protein [Schleiferia thermophila]RCX02048.1 maltose phosphorylase [Schleiferia thermophila]GCD80572.1 maltose phosphorylase [Schleiferia thermophila]